MAQIIGMPKTYRTELTVRGYELDSFGHVNHAVYVSYLEEARWHLLTEEGVELRHFKEWDRWPVIAQIELQYLKPTFMGDRLLIETKFAAFERTNFTFEQHITRGDQSILKAKVRAVMVDGNGRPASVPEKLQNLWSQSS